MDLQLGMDMRDFQLESNAGGVNSLWLIHLQNRFYKVWVAIISLCCLYSYFNKLLEFGFPMTVGVLPVVERVLEILFIADIVVQFFLSYFDHCTGHVISMHGSIARRYLKFKFSIDVVACIPWETISKAYGVPIGYLSWSRIFRLFKVHEFFKHLERDVHMNYFCTRLTKVIIVGLLWVHTAACWLYFLATSVPPGQESNTWIGSLNFGGDYRNFKEFGFLKLYITSLYFFSVTVTTVGYGDIHAVNLREMLFIISYVISGMIVSAYQLGNLTILIANGSRTSEMKNDIADLINYMKRNGLSSEICTCVMEQLQLQYARSYNEAAMFRDILISIRSQLN